jgi:orotidine-5'-phosphate decarboxylase
MDFMQALRARWTRADSLVCVGLDPEPAKFPGQFHDDPDAVTANPYLGHDSLQPFLDRADKGVVILCRTSNPGAADLQDLNIDGRPLYQHVAEKIARDWNGNGNCALVVGATWPQQLREVRAIVGDLPFLVPGVGAQGGDVEAVVTNAKTTDGTGLVVSSSRAILYASEGDDFAAAAAAAAKSLRDQIKRYRRATDHARHAANGNRPQIIPNTAQRVNQPWRGASNLRK